MIECYLYPKIIRTHVTSGLEPHLSLKHASPGHTHTHTKAKCYGGFSFSKYLYVSEGKRLLESVTPDAKIRAFARFIGTK